MVKPSGNTPNNRPMKHLLALTALLISSLAMGQFPNLPYNPDDNGDGLIGVADLQTLLANYGQEFSSAVVSEDGESAIVYMGEMAYSLCSHTCKNLPSFWDVATILDLALVWDDVAIPNGNGDTWVRPLEAEADAYRFYRFNSDNVQTLSSPTHSSRCYCAARQLPKVEYFTCKASCSDGYTALDDCVNEKLAEGWYPLQSQRQQQVYNDCFWQPLWRWAE